MRSRVALATAVATAVAGVAAAAASAYSGFWMPSRNIACAAFSAPKPYLRCDVLSGVRPAPHGRCELDWTGYSLRLRGRAFATCAGDTVAGLSKRVLAYGTTWRALGFTCLSRAAGLRCRNRDGHGFFLSRASSYPF
jgi:hypothetical protein